MRVVIAEDATLLRAGLVRLLSDRGHSVVAAVGNAPALLEAARELAPDVAVVDVRMPPDHTDDGLRAALELRATSTPPQSVLILSQYVEARYATELLTGDATGFGYLLKDRVADVREFVDAVEQVAAGGSVLDPEVVTQLLGRRRDGSALDRLTPREREALAAMAEGLTNAAIAERLVVSVGAVEKHIGNIFDKLGLVVDEEHHRRVRAVVAWLAHRDP